MIRRIITSSPTTTSLKSDYFKISGLNVDQVPDDMKEIAILSGYRTPISSPLQCLASMFYANNETLNFWTHFLPTWYFIYRLSELIQILDFTQDEFSLPFLSYMIIICLYPLVSCSAHLFSSLSHIARHICYFCDYGALSMYSYGAAVLYRSYSLPDEFLLNGSADFYLRLSFISSAASTLIACYSRFPDTIWITKVLRVSAFALPYFSAGFPVMIRVISCLAQGDVCIMQSFPHHVRQFIVAFIGTFVYSTHLPERIWPGRFDIIGHSHQWLHVCSILASNEQIMAALLDIQHRRSHILSNGWSPDTHIWICGSVIVLFLWDLVVISLFSIWVINKDSNKKA